MGKSIRTDNTQLGKWGEQEAAVFLQRKGYQIVAQNHRTPYGEIDLVAEDAGGLIFVEVKTRRSTEYGLPEEAVTELKRSHMIDSAESYLQEQPDFSGDWRIDVIAILVEKHKQVEIKHFENIA